MIRAWLVFCFCLGALLAQAPTGTVSGTVIDSSGGTVASANVAAINQETGVRPARTTSTSRQAASVCIRKKALRSL